MNKLIFIGLSFILIIILLIAGNNLIYGYGVYEEQNTNFDRTLTKAICSGNVCRDFLVECLNGNVVEMKAISGFVTFGDDWADRREEKELCI